MKMFAAIVFLSLNSFGAVRSFTGINDTVMVLVEPIKDSQQFYLKLVNTQLPDTDRVWIANLTHHMNATEEEFLVKGVDISVQLGGRHANAKAKEPFVGNIMVGTKKILLKADSRSEDLSAEYGKAECLAADKASAQKEIDQAMARANTQCATKMTVSVDWGSFSSPGLACNFRETLNALTQTCKDVDFKKAAAQLKTFNVSKGSGPALTKSGSSVSAKISDLPVNTELNARNWFENNL